MRAQTGAALVMCLILLSLTALLGMAGATTARVELRLAQDQRFRENAASAASAGIEFAVSHMTAFAIDSGFELNSPDDSRSAARFEVRGRFLGHEQQLPQAPGGGLVASHFEISSTGYSARGAVDLQRARLVRVVALSSPVIAADCEPIAPGVTCFREGQVLRLSWQRLPPP